MSSPKLIAVSLRDSEPYFQIQKEGLIFLQKYRNKKLRIIFNIGTPSQNIQQFNHKFLPSSSNQQQHHGTSKLSTQQNMECSCAYLQISSQCKELSENRTLLILNAIYNDKGSQEQTSLNMKSLSFLLVLGYLVCSCFFYHHKKNSFEAQYELGFILARLYSILSKTQINQLQQLIKYKSGFSKQPYLMCLCQHQTDKSELRTQFREHYKSNQEQSSDFNQAVDAMIEYFPNRSAVNISDDKIIEKLRQDFIDQILGRQIFSFEITGQSLENMCFEFCELYNQQDQKSIKVDLVKIYNKIIINQKSRIEDVSVELYFGLLNNLKTKLPLSNLQVAQLHRQIEDQVLKQAFQYAINCMDITEFYHLYILLKNKMKAKFEQVSLQNYEQLNNRIYKCYQQVESNDKEQQQLLQNMCGDNLQQIFSNIFMNVQIFISECVSETNVNTMLKKLIEGYFQNIIEAFGNALNSRERNIQELCDQCAELRQSKKTDEIKLRKLEEEYKYTKSINQQLKNEITKLNIEPQQNEVVFSTTITRLKAQNRYLDQQLIQKNIQIQNLRQILCRLEGDFNKKFGKPKFSKELQNCCNDLHHKMNEIHKLFKTLKDTEQFYHQIQDKFSEKKKQIEEQRNHDKKLLCDEQSKVKQAIKEKSHLQEAVTDSRKTIQVMRQTEEVYKRIIDEKQTVEASWKCKLHDIEGQMDQYKRTLQLVGDCIKEKKFDKLKKYSKVIQVKQLKNLIDKILER